MKGKAASTSLLLHTATAACIGLATLFQPGETTAASPEASTALNSGDRAFWKMEYRKADSLYAIAGACEPMNAEIWWKLARLEVSIGESLPRNDKKKRIEHYRKAVHHAQKSIRLDSTRAESHAWLAAALGMAAEKSGTKEKLRNAGEIKRQLDTALRLNPNDQTALSMLGSYYRQAAGIGWFRRMMGGTFVGKMPKGDYEDAENALKKAITLDPRVIRNYHELALVELELGHKKEAAALMEAAMDKPILFYSDRRRLRQMRHLLEKLRDD
ncbi:hypothetical protein EKD00_01440 [Chlorobium phaeovibrioides]|uniref:tetratricopeptide repeat protein n=1 Tax=Chlorobium phaeovibrioides TaxID=1094 RepID=UPI000F823301|nr:hypothetical protein [Chlorobium phaeovibrioides]RTY37416.1 hypothetical protein EKD00_01440 [Chlorobium phaeovibrioides]